MCSLKNQFSPWLMCNSLTLELEQGETLDQEQGGILLQSNKPSQHLLASRQKLTLVYRAI